MNWIVAVGRFELTIPQKSPRQLEGIALTMTGSFMIHK